MSGGHLVHLICTKELDDYTSLGREVAARVFVKLRLLNRAESWVTAARWMLGFLLALLVGRPLSRRYLVEGAPLRLHPHMGVAR
jgi:hypothetical protein